LALAAGLGLGLGGASFAVAADQQGGPEETAPTTASPPPADQSPFGEKYYPAIAPTRRRLLMSQLDRAGLADPLEEARIRLFGYAEGSYEFNFIDPAGDFNVGRDFDFEQHNKFLLNQIDLAIERGVIVNGDEWDLGGRVEMIYGSDARFLHANGLGSDDDLFNGPENQFDLLQAYADVSVPVGTGLRVRVGKFQFFKQVDPNASVFYTHSYTFGGALPYTLTGVSGLYNLSNEWSIEAGISRGWDQALDDNNDMISFHARARHTLSDRTSYAIMFMTGPELDDESGDWRTVVDLVLTHKLNDRLTVLGDAIFGWQPDFPNNAGNTVDATYWGAAGYAVYRIDDQYSVGGRAEFLRDSGGFATGVDHNLVEVTAGVTITPFPHHEIGSNLKIRPELRYDWSTKDYFDGLTERDQVTAAVDVIFNF
jgi:hypothetical protein